MTQAEGPVRGSLFTADRRMIIGAGLFGLAAVPVVGLYFRNAWTMGFTHNVASGEPGADRVLLWSRYVAEQDKELTFEVSENDAFTKPVSGGNVTASASNDWCCKAWASGLSPDRWYYYRFVAPDGRISPVGRTRTLPEGTPARWRMAVFSCSNIASGHFNAYAHAAQIGEFDLAIHTGDYIYENPILGVPSARNIVSGHFRSLIQESVALADYRIRYAAYRSDPDLQRLHQTCPMIATWDDHESANGSWKDGASNHQPASEGDWQVRKLAAMRAYREWLPVSDDLWKSYQIGDLATLIRIETRLSAREASPDYRSALKGAKSDEERAAALLALRDDVWAVPGRTMLGLQQEAWLAEQLDASTRSGRTWQVLVNQTVMGQVTAPADLNRTLPDSAPRHVKARLARYAAMRDVGVFPSLNAWGGYPAARDRLLNASRDAEARLVVLSGDSHNAWAFEFEGAGVEFAGTSVTSPGAEAAFDWFDSDRLAGALVDINPELRWTNQHQRGYLAVELTPEKVVSEFRFMDTVRFGSTALASKKRALFDANTRKLSV